MSGENRTEQATPQRRKKARDKGQVARSRELAGSLALAATIGVLVWQGFASVARWRDLLVLLLNRAAQGDVGIASLELGIITGLRWALPAMFAGLGLAVFGSLVQGGFVFAPNSLAPTMERISPAKKIPQLFSTTSLSALLKSLIPFTFIAVIAYRILLKDWSLLRNIGSAKIHRLAALIFDQCYELAWKSVLVLLLWSALDYLLVRQKQERDLRMTRQEVREEAKENEGNPQVKAKIRRMQRQIRRKKMLKDVQRATVVVTNPTHFAVALEYTPDLAAPVVLAKGQNLFAQQIKQAASWQGIPMIENPPLAQALYRTVEVGQAIPAKLYAAVAEILAFVYRTQQQLANTRRGQ